MVDSVSADRPKPVMRVSPSQIAPIRTARCETDLSPGTAMWPSRAGTGSIRMDETLRPRGSAGPGTMPRYAHLLRNPADGGQDARQLHRRLPSVRDHAGAGRGVLLHRRPSLDHGRVRP